MYIQPLFIPLIFISVVQCAYVEIKPKYHVVKERDPVVILCTANGALDYCSMEIPGEGRLSMSETKPPFNGIKYNGQGLKEGQCGAIISSAMQKHNGQIRCAFSLTSENKESSANMTLIVAKAPTRPSLSVSKSSRGNNVYREGESMTAVCTVQNGRPPANISWYLGELKLTDNVAEPAKVMASGDLFTVEQKLVRVLQASDNGKFIKCQAEHPLLLDRDASTSHPIQVHFAPKANEPIEQFGLVEGEDGRVAVVVMAHPRPSFTWNVGGQPVYENDDTNRFKVERATEVPPGSSKWQSVLIIKSLTKEDVEKDYTLTASNIQGERKFTVNLSTSPGPQGIELGAGTIIAILVAGLFVITLTAMLLFARAKGRWCFAGSRGGRVAGECSDTESAEQHVSKSKLPFTSVFKKKNDKGSSEPSSKPADTTAEEDNETYDEVKPEDSEVKLNLKKDEGVVYAELDLQNSQSSKTPARPDPDKTEYAEIIHTKEK